VYVGNNVSWIDRGGAADGNANARPSCLNKIPSLLVFPSILIFLKSNRTLSCTFTKVESRSARSYESLEVLSVIEASQAQLSQTLAKLSNQGFEYPQKHS